MFIFGCVSVFVNGTVRAGGTLVLVSSPSQEKTCRVEYFLICAGEKFLIGVAWDGHQRRNISWCYLILSYGYHIKSWND
ncbi:hypothetical protein PVAP13_7KG037400 [Panicum virgatum]|uniref:Secreted protein n=1 Tax=Panicum virgatum TaxID=38727 RepID=A0A8T0Q7K9_PANVG|nr:hypothetical protein PVAP13_7KG037400 [Panicum virgatum]